MGECVTKIFSGFWRKVDTYEEQPDIHFLHQLILILETDQVDRRIGWSTIQNFNHLLGESARVPTVKVRKIFTRYLTSTPSIVTFFPWHAMTILLIRQSSQEKEACEGQK